MAGLSAEGYTRIYEVQRKYRDELGIFAISIVFCNTCERVLYDHPLHASENFPAEQLHASERVADQVLNNHASSFHQQHDVLYIKIGMMELDGGRPTPPETASLGFLSPQVIEYYDALHNHAVDSAPEEPIITKKGVRRGRMGPRS